MSRNRKLFKELRQRKVLRVAGGYLAGALLLAQVADLAMQRFDAPDWTMRALLIALVVGFPIAVGISWAYEWTSAGVVPENEVDRTVRITDQSAQRVDLILLVIVAIVIVFMGLERLVFSKRYEPASPAMPAAIQPSGYPDDTQRSAGFQNRLHRVYPMNPVAEAPATAAERQESF